MAINLDGNGVNTTGLINSATAQASTSGTSITFTGIPSGVKRITVMFNGVSTSGTSVVLVQVGAGSVTTSGYTSNAYSTGSANSIGQANYTTGFGLANSGNAAWTISGTLTLTLLSANIWTETHTITPTSSNISGGAGLISLSGTLDRVVVTTVNGTDTFDAGSINILYE